MLIRNKTIYIFDIEVFPNVFHCSVKNTETKEIIHLEISSKRNDLMKIVDLFWQIKTEDQKGIWNKNYTTDLQFDVDKIMCG